MSHTGSVIRPSTSPGLIRIDTVGFAQKAGELVIVTPKNDNREKYVIFPASAFTHGRSGRVKFNLRQFVAKDWENKTNVNEKITKHDRANLRKEHSDLKGLRFKYIATNVKLLNEDSILEHLAQNGVDLPALEGKNAKLMSPKSVRFLGSDQDVQSIRVINSVVFDPSPDNRNNGYDKKIYQNESGVWQEIKDHGEHKMSPVEEVPTLL